ncbi:MAG: HAD-IA family hydrolase [FCB group bacterium]|nr:HAD-IA family hydrolase [FCB group bacterium]
MKKPELICYDFDGTLCNTLPDIAASMNVIFKRHGFREIPEARVRDFIGSGISKLVERSVFYVLSEQGDHMLPPERIGEIGKEMADHYSGHLTDRSYLYDHCEDVLNHFSSVPQIIVSNKPEAMVRSMLQHFKIDAYFDLIVGGDTLSVCKPDPAVWEYVVRTMKLPKRVRGMMVGDSLPDMTFGKIAGLKNIAVRYGYNDIPVLREAGADHFIDSLAELTTIII